MNEQILVERSTSPGVLLERADAGRQGVDHMQPRAPGDGSLECRQYVLGKIDPRSGTWQDDNLFMIGLSG